jgi:hypothetical protein
MQRRPLRDVLRTRKICANIYAPALLRIDRLSAAERSRFSTVQLADGPQPFIRRTKQLPRRLGEFNKELLRDQRRTTGRLDSRFIGYDRDSSVTMSSLIQA